MTHVNADTVYCSALCMGTNRLFATYGEARQHADTLKMRTGGDNWEHGYVIELPTGYLEQHGHWLVFDEFNGFEKPEWLCLKQLVAPPVMTPVNPALARPEKPTRDPSKNMWVNREMVYRA